MHVRSFGILAVIAAGIAAACNGGGGNAPNGTFGQGDYEDPPNSYDAPASDFDRPPAGDDTPPSDFDDPPESSGPGASTRRVCESICSSLLANGCAEGNVDQATCAQGCSEGLVETYDVCVEELLGVLDCVLRSPRFECGIFEDGSEVDEGAFAECEVDARAFSECSQQNPPDPGPGPGGEGGAGNL
jgi:hypothetical protein